jgi:GGDEF domain-containing protein
MGSEAVAGRATDATDWRWARDNERHVFVRVAAVGLLIGLLAVEIASLVPALSPSHVAIWRVALGAPVVLALVLMVPRCFDKPVTARFIWGVLAVGIAVSVTLIHIAPPTTAMLLTLIAVVIITAHFLSAREAIFVAALMTLAALSLPVFSPPGAAHHYSYAQLAIYIPVLWALAAIFHFQGRGLRDAVDRAIISASEDAATGAANLRSAEEDFTRRFGLVERDGRGNVGVILLNLTNLSELDRAQGDVDRVVAAVAHQLRRIGRSDWTIARVNAEDFLILVSNASDRSLEELAHLCRGAAISASTELEVALTVHVGTANAPAHGKTLDLLLDVAQARVYVDMRDAATGAEPVPATPQALHAWPSRAAAPATQPAPAREPAAEVKSLGSRLPRLSTGAAVTVDLAILALLGGLTAITGGTNSPAMMLVFVYGALQAWLWRERMIGWRLAAPVLLLLSPLLYESAVHRVNPEAQASLQLNSIVIAFVSAVVAISVHRSRSRAHAVAHHSTVVDPETHLLTRQEFEARVVDADSVLTVIGIEVKGTDRFTRSAGRSERTQMMIAIGDFLASAADEGEIVGRIGTSKFAIAALEDAGSAAARSDEIRGQLKRIVDGFAAGQVKPPRVEISLDTRFAAEAAAPRAHERTVSGESVRTAAAAS